MDRRSFLRFAPALPLGLACSVSSASSPSAPGKTWEEMTEAERQATVDLMRNAWDNSMRYLKPGR